MEELDLKELFSLFWNKKLAIILITLIATFVGVIYSYFFITPEYTATTSLVLVQASSGSQNNNAGITSTDLTINSKLVSTYSGIMKKDAILGQVAENLNLKQEEISKIRNKISAKAEQTTEIIEISAKDQNPEFAANLANEVATVFCEKIVDIYNISNTYLLDRAKVPTTPSNISHMKDIAIFAFIGIIMAVGYVLLCNMLDTTVKTEDDIEKLTGLVVLTSIPNYEAEFKDEKTKTKGGKR